MSEDITYCFHSKCTNKKCERHPFSIKQYRIPHSFAFFEECKYWDISRQQINKTFDEIEVN